MFLCIKAETKVQALTAARQWLPKREDFLCKRVNHREISLEFEATSAERLAIVKWFCAPSGPGPYPNGTLLFYSEDTHTGEFADIGRN